MIIEDPYTYTSVPPQNEIQRKFREELEKRRKKIDIPCCHVCLDTENQSTLVRMQFDTGIKYLCEFCHNVQDRM